MRVAGIFMAAVGMAATAAALAATPKPTPEERCELLQQQWKEALPQHADAPQIATAKSLHAEGLTLCLAGKTREGILKLEEALHDLGVRPEI